jgi:hypothetical protein
MRMGGKRELRPTRTRYQSETHAGQATKIPGGSVRH